MSERQLFDKSMDELREAFVRARFAEEKVFGRADIVAWLKQQRSAERPLDSTSHEIDSTWEHFPPRGQNRTDGYGLDIYATPTLPQGQLDNDPFYDVEKYGKASLALRKFNFPLFLGQSMAILQTDPTYQDSWATAFTIDWNGKSLCLTDADTDPDKFTMAVQDVLFAEWIYHRPRWDAARKILCDSAEARIKEQRAKAEADFDSAVAVSSDGTKIVCADRVVVITGAGREQKFIEFPPSAFHDRKIFRIRKLSRDGSYFPRLVPELMSRIQRGLLSGENLQLIFCSRFHAASTYFLTSERFCPSPLPDGGVELK